MLDDRGCWEWTGWVDKDGYGRIKVSGRKIRAHRLSWELHFGPIPKTDDPMGNFVLHRCDNPTCVNPSHLFLGSHMDNLRDMMSKGRSARGEKGCKAKLTAAQVLEIRSRYGTRERYKHGPVSQYDLAAEYGVTQAAINSVILRKTWRHI
jgi:hypothetical protein